VSQDEVSRFMDGEGKKRRKEGMEVRTKIGRRRQEASTWKVSSVR
jgi:hypothetical protein